MTYREAAIQAMKECGLSADEIGGREAFADRETLGLEGTLGTVDKPLDKGTEREVIEDIKRLFKTFQRLSPLHRNQIRKQLMSEFGTTEGN